MKRQVVAVVLGSLFALPAFANNEIDAGNLPPDVATTMTRAQVRADLIAAHGAGDLVLNLEGGHYVRELAPSGKSRAQVRSELIAAHDAGNIFPDLMGGIYVF